MPLLTVVGVFFSSVPFFDLQLEISIFLFFIPEGIVTDDLDLLDAWLPRFLMLLWTEFFAVAVTGVFTLTEPTSLP